MKIFNRFILFFARRRHVSYRSTQSNTHSWAGQRSYSTNRLLFLLALVDPIITQLYSSLPATLFIFQRLLWCLLVMLMVRLAPFSLSKVLQNERHLFLSPSSHHHHKVSLFGFHVQYQGRQKNSSKQDQDKNLFEIVDRLPFTFIFFLPARLTTWKNKIIPSIYKFQEEWRRKTATCYGHKSYWQTGLF